MVESNNSNDLKLHRNVSDEIAEKNIRNLIESAKILGMKRITESFIIERLNIPREQVARILPKIIKEGKLKKKRAG